MSPAGNAPAPPSRTPACRTARLRFGRSRLDAHQVETSVAEIRAAIERVAADPHRGRPFGELREGYRRYGIGAHVSNKESQRRSRASRTLERQSRLDPEIVAPT